MGPALSPEDRQKLQDKFAAHERHVASLRTARGEASAPGRVTDGDGCQEDGDAAPGTAHATDGCQPGRPEARKSVVESVDEKWRADGVDEEAVLAFFRTRQEIIARQAARIRVLEAEATHQKTLREQAERKCELLRAELAKR